MQEISSVQECRDYYASINNLVEEFISRFAARPRWGS